MASYTSYLNLEMPTVNEKYDVLKQNQNWQKVDDGCSALNSNMENISSIVKKTGTKEIILEAIGYQYNASTVLVSLMLPFNTNNNSYTVTLDTVSIIGQGAISLSDITIDSKGYTYIRLSIAKSGTVGTPMLINARLTIAL